MIFAILAGALVLAVWLDSLYDKVRYERFIFKIRLKEMREREQWFYRARNDYYQLYAQRPYDTLDMVIDKQIRSQKRNRWELKKAFRHRQKIIR